MPTKCKVCKEDIPEGRVKAIPGVTTCVKHSTTLSYKVNQVTKSDEDYTELEFTNDPDAIQELERMDRSYKKHNNIPE